MAWDGSEFIELIPEDDVNIRGHSYIRSAKLV